MKHRLFRFNVNKDYMTFISLFFINLKEFYVFNGKNQLSMPIKSYLAHPHENKKEALITALSAFEECEVTPATNEDILVLVTDTLDDASEEILKEKIEKIDSLKLLAMVSGFNSPQNQQ